MSRLIQYRPRNRIRCRRGRGRAADAAARTIRSSKQAKHKAYTEKINDKVSFDMMPIPGGTFLMGSPDDEKGRDANEGPQHPVTRQAVLDGKCEVTWDEYDIYWENRPKGRRRGPTITKKPDKLTDAITSPTPPYEDPTFGYGRRGLPGHRGHASCGDGVLPLAVEEDGQDVSPADGGGMGMGVPGGHDDAVLCRRSAKLGDYAWYEKNSNDMPHPVGKKKPNAWGLHDMHGNVAEWCLDSYQKDFYATLAEGQAVAAARSSCRRSDRYPDVARGGSWIDRPEKCRSAVRRGSDKTWLKRDPQSPQSIWWMTDADWVGFRVVRAVEEDERLKGVRSKVTWWSD